MTEAMTSVGKNSQAKQPALPKIAYAQPESYIKHINSYQEQV